MVLPLSSLIDLTSLRTAMPSAPYDLSSWNICLVATPLAFQEIQVSTVVAAHCTSPDAMARCRSFCGIFLIVTSRPFFLKMPAWFASVSGANPVHPEIPIPTLTSSAMAGVDTRRAAVAASILELSMIVFLRQVYGLRPVHLLKSSRRDFAQLCCINCAGSRPH